MRIAFLVSLFLACPWTIAQDKSPTHGDLPRSLEIRNVHVLRGDGSPAVGPTDVYVVDGIIASKRPDHPEVSLDGSGCYLLPGFVNTHGHLHDVLAGIPISAEYICNLWLSCGITTVRDNGSSFPRTLRLRLRSAEGKLDAPRILIYRVFGSVDTGDEAVQRVRSFKKGGADGIKLVSFLGYVPEILEAILGQAKREGLPVTAHIGVGGSDAVSYSKLGVSSIEHWYGIPDAAIQGVQDFPPDFSYANEAMRFREAGKLWRQTDPELLQQVLQTMVDYQVSWSPTLAIYEANRDLLRARNKPWFADNLHPALAKFFTPGKGYHGSYFLDWTSTDEANWRENYSIWMSALRQFASLGGNITTGEDAGYMYVMYGFGLLRELEMHQEAGFHPLQVLRHASYNGAKLLGKEQKFGRIMPGMQADMLLVQGNPLQNLKLLYPKAAGFGEGIRWTIKGGRLLHVPTMMGRVRAEVEKARAKLADVSGG